jgi:hypothetical protein
MADEIQNRDNTPSNHPNNLVMAIAKKKMLV